MFGVKIFETVLLSVVTLICVMLMTQSYVRVEDEDGNAEEQFSPLLLFSGFIGFVAQLLAIMLLWVK